MVPEHVTIQPETLHAQGEKPESENHRAAMAVVKSRRKCEFEKD
jgi:hypothetical protein